IASVQLFKQVFVAGVTGYFVSGPGIAGPPPVLPAGPAVLQGYSSRTINAAGFGPCTNSTSLITGNLFFPLSTVDLSGFVPPFHVQ
ncbi:MAG: hypothetical protein JF613_10090, partial [Acidobacteria bacterium]|nr:hypothetical protein [Acidobacteriota bacterium]